MARTSATFNALYRRLNAEQRRAVDAIEGPVMVVAGPGTGKTQILTLRIANILRTTDARAENILALTFTESGAHAMRKKLAEIIGASAYRVTIATFHGFCAEVIRTYPEAFPRIIGARLAPEVEQIALIETLVRKLPLTYLKPFGDPLYHVRAIRGAIEHLKRENISERSFGSAIKKERAAFSRIKDLRHQRGAHKGLVKSAYAARKKQLLKNEELLRVYEAYQRELLRRRLYDYNDMIVEVIRALEKDTELLLALQERYLYLLADEHQDANNAQNRLLELLASYHANPNLFIVGDEMQAIFRFQGASLENFVCFRKRYPRALRVVLSTSYRSTQAILDSSHSLMSQGSPVKDAASLRASSRIPGKKIKVYEFSREEIEHSFVADEIGKLLKKGTPPQEVAVIYRDNKDAFPLAEALGKRGIDFVVESDENILDDPNIRKVVALLSAVADFGNEEHLVPVLHIPFLKLDPLLLWRILEYARKEKKNVLEALKSPPRSLGSAGEVGRLRKIYALLASWKALAGSRNLADFFEVFLRESGALAWLLQGARPYEAMEKLDVLYDELKTFIGRSPDATLPDFVQHLSLLKKHEVLVRRGGARRPMQAVRLMTAHRAKGQEFEAVFIVGVYDGHWGSRRVPRVFHLPMQADLPLASLEKDEQGDGDERRLFYVALTRARSTISLSYSRFSAEGRERLPSRFIEEIDGRYKEEVSGAVYEKAYPKTRAAHFGVRSPRKEDLKSKDFIRELFLARGLSVTALNNYLRCPWEFFYVNLLRVPRALSPYQMYGTAVHYALTRFFKEQKKGKVLSRKLLLGFFDEGLHSLPLSRTERARYRARGSSALLGYWRTWKGTWTHAAEVPFVIQGVSLQSGVTLRGELDKMEYVGPSGVVNVVDWKTGAPRSRAVITGEAGNASGNYYRQLVFYKLLLERVFTGKYRMVSGEIDFVEPTSSGKYKKERFEITDQEVTELEHLIDNTAEEIMDLKFFSGGCNRKECRWCTFRAMMR